MAYTLKDSNIIFELGGLSGTVSPYPEVEGDTRIRSKFVYIDNATTITCTCGYYVVLCGNSEYKIWTQNLHVYTPQVAR